jgi:single-strand DNA-binding protein
MFGDLNKVQIIGNLGKEPDLRYTPSGTAVATFSVASNRNIKKGDNWEKETEWFRVVVWREQAESAAKFLTKGKRVYIEGRLQTRKWDDKGVEKYTTEVIAENIILLEKSGKGEGGPPIDDSQDPQPWKQGNKGSSSAANSNPFEEDEGQDLEDIPF